MLSEELISESDVDEILLLLVGELSSESDEDEILLLLEEADLSFFRLNSSYLAFNFASTYDLIVSWSLQSLNLILYSEKILVVHFCQLSVRPLLTVRKTAFLDGFFIALGWAQFKQNLVQVSLPYLRAWAV